MVSALLLLLLLALLEWRPAVSLYTAVSSGKPELVREAWDHNVALLALCLHGPAVGKDEKEPQKPQEDAGLKG